MISTIVIFKYKSVKVFLSSFNSIIFTHSFISKEISFKSSFTPIIWAAEIKTGKLLLPYGIRQKNPEPFLLILQMHLINCSDIIKFFSRVIGFTAP